MCFECVVLMSLPCWETHGTLPICVVKFRLVCPVSRPSKQPASGLFSPAWPPVLVKLSCLLFLGTCKDVSCLCACEYSISLFQERSPHVWVHSTHLLPPDPFSPQQSVYELLLLEDLDGSHIHKKLLISTSFCFNGYDGSLTIQHLSFRAKYVIELNLKLQKLDLSFSLKESTKRKISFTHTESCLTHYSQNKKTPATKAPVNKAPPGKTVYSPWTQQIH